MALESSRVATGAKILSTHINKLWNDLVKNHTHADGEGGAVDHKNLVETAAMSGVNHTHSNIETHMMGNGSSFVDTPGGAYGVHELPSVHAVLGSAGFVTEIEPEGGQAASPSLERKQVSILMGSFIPNSTESDVHFGTTFTEPPLVVVSFVDQVLGGSAGWTPTIWLKSVETSKFTVCHTKKCDQINWMAAGVEVTT